MRVIAGSAKGRALKVPREVSRPTTDRVRESLFGIIDPLLRGARTLDLFAGSGALGIEALSRGAQSCYFIEQNRGAVKTIEENLRKLGLDGGRVIAKEVGAFLATEKGQYDFIFADPPYPDGLRDPAADLVSWPQFPDLLTENGYLILESESYSEVACPPGLVLAQSRDYGRSHISFFQRKES